MRRSCFSQLLHRIGRTQLFFHCVVERANERAFRADDRGTIRPGQFRDQPANFLIRFGWSFQIAATIEQFNGDSGTMFRDGFAQPNFGNGRFLGVIEVALALVV